VCPVEAALAPGERLYVPHRKRLYHSYSTNAEGARELRIDYGVKEITFDEVHLFPFGERLVRETSFTGLEAMQWGPGYSWDELVPLFDALLAEGVIKRGGSDPHDDPRDPRGGGLVPALLPPSVCPAHRFWSNAECEAISRDLTDHAFELGYLETVVPVFRIAHPALDADGRQVGEGNVFPPRLRMDIETEWRVCQYSGSRYRDDAPMNVTGLKAMIKHWKPMMATLLHIRRELRHRLGPAERWTIGELHLLASIVLAVPTYQLMMGGGATPQRPLHPVLSSLFRITDGVRMTTYEMLFAIEHPRRADEPLTAAQLYDHAEMYAILIGETGVCAGPRPLIDEFLATAVDGLPAEGIDGLALPAEVQALVDDLPAAVDYGLLGMQSWATSLSIWLEMSRTYEALLPIVEAAAPGHPAAERLLARLRASWKVLEQLQITFDYDRDVHFKAYLDAYEQSWRAARTKIGPPTLAAAVAPYPDGPAYRDAADRLHAMLQVRVARGELPAALDDAATGRVANLLANLLRHEQAILASTTALQHAINTLLDRPRPTRPLCVRDFLATYALNSGPGVFPYIFDTLDAELGIRVDTTASAIAIADRRAS